MFACMLVLCDRLLTTFILLPEWCCSWSRGRCISLSNRYSQDKIAVSSFCFVIAFPVSNFIPALRRSPEGFVKAGGFGGVYRGLSVVSLGAAPGGIS